MSTIITLLISIVSFLFLRACLVTLGYYKEPILSAFQKYGDEVGFSPLFEAFMWATSLAYLLFMLLVPSSLLILLGIIAFVTYILLYWKVKDNIMSYPEIFMRFPRWYRDIVDHTSREERRKLSYMWLGLPLRTRLRYNAQHNEFRNWVELVVLSVA